MLIFRGLDRLTGYIQLVINKNVDSTVMIESCLLIELVLLDI